MPVDPSPASESPVSQMLTSLQEVGSNLAFIRQELPGLDMPEDQRRGFLEICGTLSKDVDGLQARIERLEGASPAGSVAIEAIQAHIRGQVTRLDESVKAARSLAAAEPKCVAVKILIEESGANMLRAYVRIWDSLEHLRARV